MTPDNKVFMFYLGLLVTAAAFLAYVVVNVYGQVIIQPEPTDPILYNEAIIENLTISYENGTIASLNDTAISQDRGDYIVWILNIVLGGAEEDELPQYSIVQMEDIIATEQESLEDAEEEIIDDTHSDNDNGDNGDDPE